MRPTLAAVVLVLSAALAAGQEKDARAEKFVSKEGKYSVGFPGKPTTSSNKAGAVDLNMAIVQKGAGGYAVIHSDLPADAVKVAKPKELLDGGQNGLINNFKAKVTSSKDFEFGKQKYPARELVGEKDQITLRIQIILADNRLYQVFVVGPQDMATGKDADAFFKSFEITK